MLEAACAYFEATGKRVLLDVMIKKMEYIYSVFMDESSTIKFNGVPGHPKFELALMKLYSQKEIKAYISLKKI